MIQLYPSLHNTDNHFKKHFLWISLLLFAMLYTGIRTNAQCPVVNVSPVTSCGGLQGVGPCSPLTASGNADTYVWSPLAGLFMDCQMTIPYTGTSTTIVHAAPTSYTVYTVTGTITASGCSSTATTRVNYTPPPPIVTPNPAVMCLGDPPVKLKVGSPQSSVQFCSGPVNIAVPDNNATGVANSISVSGLPAGCIITNMTVTINMPHTYPGDMVINLRAPNGQILSLYKHNTNTNTGTTSIPTAGFFDAVVSNIATTTFSAVQTPYRYGQTPTAGPYRPDALNGVTNPGYTIMDPTGYLSNAPNFASLYSTSASANGSWTLAMADGGAGDLGTLISWCLGITYSCGSSIPADPAVWSPSAGLFFNQAATVPYIPGTPIDSVWARPAPAGTYTYAVTTTSLPGPLASFTNPATISIPVGGAASPYASNVTVSVLPTGAKVRSVVLNGVNHTRSNDIDVLLQSPSGQNVMLMSDIGDVNAINGTYTFIDWRAPMSLNFANPPGTYQPTNNGQPDNFPAPGPGNISASTALGTFTGNMNGTWKLFVFDDDGTGDQGMISGGYTINFDTVAPCYSLPTYVPVTVGGLPISITAQPTDQTICTGGNATFTVAATGGGTLSYQWQESSNGSTYTNISNGGIYSGATTATLTVTAPPLSMSGYYFRLLINGTTACAAITSASARLTVNPLPNIVITANPLIIGPGETTTISSTVTPNPAAIYSWYYNGGVLPGEVSPNLVVNYGSPGDYQLKVTDINGCTNLSNIITIANSFALTMYTYPNPNGGIFQVRYFSEPNNTLQRSLTVYDNRGEKIITRNFTQTIPFQKIDVDVRAHGKGLYWVEVRDANGKRLGMNRVVVQ